MNSNSFNLCSRFHQREIVCKKGIFLVSYHSTNFTYLLYQVSQFYVEEIRDKTSGFKFGYYAFDDVAMLNGYLSSIDISCIYNKCVE